jgi:hypothetical protein
MKKTRIVMTSIALLTALFVLGFASCGDKGGGTTTTKSGDATLSSVTINGVPATLGTPAATFEAITTPGSITLLNGAVSSVVATPTNNKALAPLFDKYPFGDAGPDYMALPPGAFADTGEALAIQVKAENGTIRYYRINVTIAAVALESLSVGGTDVTLAAPGATWQTAIAASVLFDYEVTEQPEDGLAVLAVAADEGSTLKYGHAAGTASPEPFTETSTIIFLDGEYLYIQVTSAENAIGYYKVQVNFKQKAIIKYGSPTIADNVIDPLWNDPTIQTYAIEKIYPGDSSDDFKAKDPSVWTTGIGRALWDEDGLYIYVRVTDPDVSSTPGAGSTAHEVDSVELFVNEAYPDLRYAQMGSQYRLGANGERSGEGNSPAAFEELDKSSAWKTDDGYIVIFQVPWRFKSQKPLADGRQIGFELQINACTETVRDGVVVWNNVAHTNYQNANDYGVAALELGDHELKIDAAPPTFTLLPASAYGLVGGTFGALSVDATVPDGGTITYQWYKATSGSAAGEVIGGATSKTYTPTDSVEGDYYYYAVATNTNNAATGSVKVATTTSGRARLQVFAAGSIVVEQITLRQGVAIYKFELPGGAKWSDYEDVSVDYKLDADNIAKTLRFNRLYGNFKTTDFTGTYGSYVFAPFDTYNASMILADLGGAWGAVSAAATVVAAGGAADTWFTQTYKTDGSTKNTGYNNDNMPGANDTGPFYFGIGLSGTGDADQQVTQLVRNITLKHKTDATKNIVTLTSGLGGGAFASYPTQDAGMGGNSRLWRTEDAAVASDFTVNFTTASLTGVGGATIVEQDATSFTYQYGGGYQGSFVTFEVTFPAGISLVNYDSITVTIQGIQGDTGWKPTGILGAVAPVLSTQTTYSSNPVVAVDGATHPTHVAGAAGGQQYTQNEQTLTYVIDKTKAAGLEGTVEFSVYEHSGATGSGVATQFKISNVTFEID